MQRSVFLVTDYRVPAPEPKTPPLWRRCWLYGWPGRIPRRVRHLVQSGFFSPVTRARFFLRISLSWDFEASLRLVSFGRASTTIPDRRHDVRNRPPPYGPVCPITMQTDSCYSRCE
jgi:hypothetical protein